MNEYAGDNSKNNSAVSTGVDVKARVGFVVTGKRCIFEKII